MTTQSYAAAKLQHFEKVDGAFDALCRAGDFMTCADPRAWIRKSNILLDACIDAEMPYDADPAEWAPEYITAALVSA